jgi:hypothetical protein
MAKHVIYVPARVNPHDLKTEDEWLASDFLGGWGETETTPHGVMKSPVILTRYFKKGTDREARQALIRVLRSDKPLSRTLRKQLAELFEIKSSIAERRLEFIFRRGPKRSTQRKKEHISFFVALKLDEFADHPKAKSIAISLASEHFLMSKQKIYEHLDPDLKRQYAGREKSPPIGRKG